MTCVSIIIRGTTVLIEAQFLDVNGLPAAPAQVELTLDYVSGTTRTSASFPMAFDLNTDKFFYQWNSTPSQPCEVFWSIRTNPATQPAYAGDGRFTLAANSANLLATTPLL